MKTETTFSPELNFIWLDLVKKLFIQNGASEVNKRRSCTAIFSVKRMLNSLMEDIKYGFRLKTFVGRIQRSLSRSIPHFTIFCGRNFMMKTIQMHKQCYIAKQPKEIISLKIDKITTSVALFGIFGLSETFV